MLPVQIDQLAFQLGLFFLHFLDDDLAKHLVQLPQIICGHRPKHVAIYRSTPIDIHPESPTSDFQIYDAGVVVMRKYRSPGY